MSMPSRLQNLRSLLSGQQIDAIFISQPTNRYYLSGFTGSDGYLLVSHSQAILVTDFRYTEQARQQASEFRVFQISSAGFANWIPTLVAELGVKRIAFESNDLTFSLHRDLVGAARRLAPELRPRLVPTHGIVESLRSVKEPHEVDMIRNAASLADATVEHAATLLKPGITENEMAWSLELFLRESGSGSMPFPIIVASGPNSARPHAQPTDRVINEGEPIVIDLGARFGGYCSDITRTLFMGKPDENMAGIYSLVREAQNAAITGISAGMSGDTADQLARKIITDAGYGDSFGHGLGHGVGLDVHEQPRLGSKSDDVLTSGMVFTIEPGIYIEGRGGIRIEDMVLLEESGPRLLTQAKTSEIQEGQ